MLETMPELLQVASECPTEDLEVVCVEVGRLVHVLEQAAGGTDHYIRPVDSFCFFTQRLSGQKPLTDLTLSPCRELCRSASTRTQNACVK